MIYANRALLEFCPDLIGRSLAEVFLESEQVEEVIGVATRSGPFRLTLRGIAAEIPVNAEFGPIGACSDHVSHYVWVANWQLWHKSPLWCSLAQIGRVSRRDCTSGFSQNSA